MEHARGFIVGCANRVTLISWEAEHTEQQIGQVLWAKKTTLSAYYIRVTKWLVTCLQSNPIGTNFAGFCSNLKQFYWYKPRGLLFKLRRPRAFQLSRGLFTGCILIGWLQVTRWGQGIPPFHGKPKPKSQPPASPSPGSPTWGTPGINNCGGPVNWFSFGHWGNFGHWNPWPAFLPILYWDCLDEPNTIISVTH